MAAPIPWYEDDSFWQTLELVFFNPERLQRAAAEVESLLRLAETSPNGRVLDLGCGIGRHSLEFARRGFSVTGVDRTGAYLQQAIRKAEEGELHIDFVQADMRDFVRPAAFDLVINMFSSFGYFDDPEDDRRVVDNVFNSLKTGGFFIMEMMGKEILARDFRERDWYEVEDHLVLEERKPEPDWSRLHNRWIIFYDNKRFEHRFSIRIYAAAELTALLKQTGFPEVKVYGGTDGKPYDHRRNGWWLWPGNMIRNLDRNKRMMPAGTIPDPDSQIQKRMHQEYVIGYYKPQ